MKKHTMKKREISLRSLGRNAKLTVPQAEAMIREIKQKIDDLGPCPDPDISDLKPDLMGLHALICQAWISLQRDNFPKYGVCSQFGVDVTDGKWTISFMPQKTAHNNYALLVNAKVEEFRKNEDEHTTYVELPREWLAEVMKAVCAAIDQPTIGASWDANNWISAHFSNCPVSLSNAYSNYVPFAKDGDRHEMFDNWFKSGIIEAGKLSRFK